jgi:hypothetical protein
MKHLLLAALLLFAACTDIGRTPQRFDGVMPGTIENVEPVELPDPAAQPDDGDDEGTPEYGDRVVVRLDDGRTVYLVYTGPRRFHTGQVVRVRVTDSSVFIV